MIVHPEIYPIQRYEILDPDDARERFREHFAKTDRDPSSAYTALRGWFLKAMHAQALTRDQWVEWFRVFGAVAAQCGHGTEFAFKIQAMMEVIDDQERTRMMKPHLMPRQGWQTTGQIDALEKLMLAGKLSLVDHRLHFDRYEPLVLQSLIKMAKAADAELAAKP